MKLQHRALLVLSLVLATSVPVGVAVAQTTTRVSIGANALLVGFNPFFGNSQVNVPLKVECGGLTGSVSVFVSQQRPPFGVQTGSGAKNVTCNNQQQDVLVTVSGSGFPGFELGEASASATLFASATDTDERTIHIVAR